MTKAVIAAFAVIAVAGAVGVVLALSPHDRSGSTASWTADALRAFGGSSLVTVIQDATGQADGLVSGTVTPDALRRALTPDLAQMTLIRDQVVALRPFPGNRMVGDMYARSAQLEVEWVRVLLDTADVPAGPARAQLMLLARRVRQLADRVFDRGTALIAASAGPTTTDPNIVVERPDDVPDWTAAGLAAGPPLDTAPPTSSGAVPSRPATRPTQPRGGWIAAVARTQAPTPSALAGAIYAGDPAACQRMARALVAAAEALRAAPDPAPNGREESARLRLGLLIDADAARAAQLAALIGPAGSNEIASAERLLVIGQGLWSSDLGPHSSSLDPRILVGNGR